jgi:hypothetical protein
MGKYWPVIMWYHTITKDGLCYTPSHEHHKDNKVVSCVTYEDALMYALRRIKPQNNDGLPVFIPWIIKGARPDVSTSSTLRLLVNRIDLKNEDVT